MKIGNVDKNRSIFKLLLSIFGGFLILFLVIFLSLPTLFSTSYGKKLFISLFDKRSGSKLKIDSVALSWFGSQKLEKLQITEEREGIFFYCKELNSDASLWKILFRNDLGQLRVTGLDVEIRKAILPTTHLKRKSFDSASISSLPTINMGFSRIPVPFTGQILAEKGKVTINSPGLDPILFQEIDLNLDLTRHDKLAFYLNSLTFAEKTQGKILVNAQASKLENPIPDFLIEVVLSQLPTLGIDQITSIFIPELSGLLQSALGNTVDLNCQFNANSDNFQLSLSAKSPQMSARIATQTSPQEFFLQEPAMLQITITPSLMQKLSHFAPLLKDLSLFQPAPVQLTISQFSCPLPASGKDFLMGSFKAAFYVPSQTQLALQNKPFNLKELAVQMESKSILEGITFKASSGIHPQGQQNSLGTLQISGMLALSKGRFELNQATLDAAKLPSELISILTSTSLSYSELIGPTIDLNCSLDKSKNQPRAHFEFQSDYLSLKNLGMSYNKVWSLDSPAELSYILSPKVKQYLSSEKTSQIENAKIIIAKIQKLSTTLDNLKNIQLFFVVNSPELPAISFKNFSATFDINTLDQIALQMEAENFKATLQGSLNLETSVFSLVKPFNAQIIVDDKQIKNITSHLPGLLKPAKVSVSLDPMQIPFSGFSLNQLKAKGQLSVEQIVFASQNPNSPYVLQNLQIPVQWDPIGKNISLQFAANVNHGDAQTGSAEGQFALSKFQAEKRLDFTTAVLDAKVDLANISSAFIDELIRSPKFSALAGPSFSSKIGLQSSLDKQSLSFKCKSLFLDADMGFFIENDRLQLLPNSQQLIWTMTPENYPVIDAWMTGNRNNLMPFSLAEPSVFTTHLTKLSLPVIQNRTPKSLMDRLPTISWDLNALQIALTGNNSKLNFVDKNSKEIIQLSPLNFSLSKSAAQGPLETSLECYVLTQASSAQSAQSTKNGLLSLQAKLKPTLNASGDFDAQQLTTSLILKAQQLPSRALDLLARAKGRTDFPFSTLFGNQLNATVSFDLKDFSGPVALNINSALTRASLNGTLVSGSLMLNEEVHAQMQVTPEISRLLLKEVNPLNLSYFYSKDPVTIMIPAKGVYLPLYPFNAAKIALPDCTIELGKVACRNEGNVNITLGLLKTKQFDKNGELALWFAPLDFSIQKGIVQIDRTEILLADSFNVCLWGEVDLVKNYVDMTLGLTAQSLYKAFGIENLPENYVLRIPMKGPSDNVQINTAKATAKVALLIAWQQKALTEAFGKNPAGAIVGELLGRIATLPDADAKIPPPKHPFPWEVGGKPKKTSSEVKEKKRKFKQNEKPLKQILKVIK